MTVPDLTVLTPNARALYWYLRATEPTQPWPTVAASSGIPRSSLYKTAAAHPDLFRTTPSGVTLITSPSPVPTTRGQN